MCIKYKVQKKENVGALHVFGRAAEFLHPWSKASDRTNHNLLFAKLIRRNLPMCIVRLLMSLFRHQTMQV